MTAATADIPFAPTAWSPALRWLHWGVALLIFAAIALGVAAINMPRTPLRSEVLNLHKSIGITVLGLAALRIVVRLAVAAPRYVPPLDTFARIASKLGHLALYALMIGLPLSGYVYSSAGNHPFDWFGLFPVPMEVPRDDALGKLASEIHYIFAWGIGAMLVVHIGAAVWHWRVRKDNVLARMWPNA